MAHSCPKCGQPVQTTDETCWHCGTVLTPAAAAKTAVRTAAESATDSPATAVSFATVTFYAGLTAVTLILFLLLTQALRQQPLYRLIPGIPRPRGWTAVTDQAVRFTFNLPPGWVVSQPGRPSPARPFADAVDQPEIQAIRRHYARLSGQPVPLLVAGHESVPAHLLMAELPPTSFSELRRGLQTFPAVENIEISQHPLDFEQILFWDRPTVSSTPWRCVGRLFAWQPAPYLMVVCVPSSAYNLITDDIRPVLNSFQPLAR